MILQDILHQVVANRECFRNSVIPYGLLVNFFLADKYVGMIGNLPRKNPHISVCIKRAFFLVFLESNFIVLALVLVHNIAAKRSVVCREGHLYSALNAWFY